MFRNYIAAALRNLVRDKLYASINIIGLAVGFAAALLIALFVRDEFSYDKWIPEFERTFLVADSVTIPGRSPIATTRTPVNLAQNLRLDFSSIEAIARLRQGSVGLRRGEVEASETIYWADPDIFKVIALPAIAGDLQNALRRPDGIVLTRSMARKYFGRDDPIGEAIEIDRQHTMIVTAILEDLPHNTHLDTEIIASGEAPFSFLAERDSLPSPKAWFATVYTYVRLAPGASAKDLEGQLPPFLDRRMRATMAASAVSLQFLTLNAIHLSSFDNAMKPGGDLAATLAMSIVSVLIIVLAVINFVNLMTARATRRMIEIGVRKISGAYRRDLIVQFIGETIAYATLAMALAIIFSTSVLPVFNTYLDRRISPTFWLNPSFGSLLLISVVVVGIAAGTYPAFVLSRFRPAVVLKGKPAWIAGPASVRQILVGLQFAFLIALITATTVIYRQASFAMNERLRLSTDQVLMVATPCRTGLKDAVATLPGVKNAACSWLNGWALGPVSTTYKRPDAPDVILSYAPVDIGYFELYGIQPVAGRLFSSDHPSDSVPSDLNAVMEASLVINETAARKLGFASPSAAIGQRLSQPGVRKNVKPSEIIGVIPDFAFDTVHQAVAPMVYYDDPLQFSWLNIKLSGRDVPETLSAIDRLWKTFGKSRPITRVFLDQQVNTLYSDITRQRQLFSALGAIALFIALLGLFGLAAYTAEQRTKEIGIRKAMGANAADILRLLLWQFTKPVLWANVIAWPAGYVVMHRWLEGFAYHIALEPWIFLAASMLALVIAVLTVTGHALMVARSQPAAALRYE